MIDYRKTKIHIKSEEHSKAFQEAVFAAGGKWCDSGEFYLRDVNFIFVNDSLSMSLCGNAVFFEDHDYKEIQFPTKDVYAEHKETQMKRKVRKDFDTTAEYSVDVSKCTEEEKKEVQQGFFDADIVWRFRGAEYQFLDAAQYSNKYSSGGIAESLLYGGMTKGCNMTAEEFLDLVYEPEIEGHTHAELMAQYAEDAKTHAKPWKLWQFYAGSWCDCMYSPAWATHLEYRRRKPKTKLIHGTEVPDLSFTPLNGEDYYFICLSSDQLVKADYHSEGCVTTKLRAIRGLCYPHTVEGRQAAILHAEALLGIA